MANQQFLKDTASTFKTYIYQDNRKIVPTSATITVFNPGTTTAIVSAQVMTVAGDGLLSYDLTAANNDTADENYKTEISYVVDGDTIKAFLYYDVVNSIVQTVITDDDVILELPQLRDSGQRAHGTATSGSTTTIINIGLKTFSDDFFTGGRATSFDQDLTRDITDFVSSTGTVTTEAFPSAISTDKYLLVRSYSREIIRAMEKIEQNLREKGRRAHLIIDSYDLRNAHIFHTVAEVCKGLSSDQDDVWWALWKDYESRAGQAMRNINLKYDESEDGVISPGEEDRKINASRTTGRA